QGGKPPIVEDLVYWENLLSQWWMTPVMGGLAGLLTFVAGRRFFSQSSARLSNAAANGEASEAGPTVDPFVNGPPSERRLAVRRAGNAIEVDLLEQEGDVTVVSGWVVNRSLGGLCVEVERPIPVGATLRVKIRN